MTNSEKANIKSEAYGYAIADATKAIELDRNFVKVFAPGDAMTRVFCSALLH